jgi:hypothetical protein
MPVELAEVIARLRAELIEAMRAGADAPLQFELGPVEVELTFSVDKEAAAGAKVRFWVVDATTDGKLASGSQQRIKLTLDPRTPDRPGVRPIISGAAEPDEQ